MAAIQLPVLAVSIEQAALASDRATVSALGPLVEAAANDLLAALHTWRDEVLRRGGAAHRDRTLKESARRKVESWSATDATGGAETTINLDDSFTPSPGRRRRLLQDYSPTSRPGGAAES